MNDTLSNEALLNKKVSIERCITQINRYYATRQTIPFKEDHFKQDAIAMNLQRACQRTIDIANYLVKRKKLEFPQSSRHSFTLLQNVGVIDAGMTDHIQAIVKLCDTSVHEDQQLDLSILIDVIEHRLGTLLAFADIALSTLSDA